MKRFFGVIIGFVLSGLISCTSIGTAGSGGRPEAASDGISLEEAVQKAAREIEAGHREGGTVAVVNINSLSIDMSAYLQEELIGELVRGRKLTVVDRRHLEQITAELDFQMSGAVGDESARSVGRMAGAQAVVVGDFERAGAGYRFRVFSIDVESGVRESTALFDVRRDPRVRSLMHEVI
jgi:TolB-like protein